jgi:hypothetical protein
MNQIKIDGPIVPSGCRRTLTFTDNLRAMHRLTNANLEAMNRFGLDELYEGEDERIHVTLSGRLRVAHEVFRPLSYRTRIVCRRPHYVAARATVKTHWALYEWLATASLSHDGGDLELLKVLAEERALDGALRLSGVGLDYPGEVQNVDWDDVRYSDDTCAV